MFDMLRKPWILVGLFLLAAIAFYLFRPDTLFVDQAVDESLEQAFDTSPNAAGSGDLDTGDSDLVEETGPDAAAPDLDTSGDDEAAADVSATAASESPASDSAAPVAERSGDFYGLDHQASGTATIYASGDQRALRFEDDTDIQNGPDLYVWLIRGQDYAGGTPLDPIDLGRLKGNVGGQNYMLPEDFDTESDWTVLIWCRRFGVPFAAAPLR